MVIIQNIIVLTQNFLFFIIIIIIVSVHEYAIRRMFPMAQFWRSETTFENLFPAFTLDSRD